MKKLRHNTAAENSVKRYIGPMIKVVSVKAHGMLCTSNVRNPDSYSTEMEEGDDNW